MNVVHFSGALILLLCIALLLVFYTRTLQAQELAFENTDTRFNQHEIFQNLDAQQKNGAVRAQGINEYLTNLKNLLDVSPQDNLTFKITTIKSGPLKQHFTQMVDLGPGFKTHEGFISEASKGYGIKFTYAFD